MFYVNACEPKQLVVINVRIKQCGIIRIICACVCVEHVVTNSSNLRMKAYP
jgi:hypothetical protein